MKDMGKHEGAARFGAGALTAALPRAGALVSPALRSAALCCIYFLLALFLARASVAGVLAPFGVSFTAAVSCRRAGRRLHAVMALLGSLIGYGLAAGAVDGLKYGAAAALCFTAGLILRTLPALRRPWFAPLAAAGALSLTLLVYVAGSGFQAREFALFLCETVLAAGAAYAYGPIPGLLDRAREAKTERPPNFAPRRTHARNLACFAACSVSFVLVLCAFPPVFGMSAGRAASVFLCLLASSIDPLYGCACGLLTGLACGAALGGGAQAAVIYAAAAFFAGFFTKFGLFGVALSFTIGNAALVPWLWTPPRAQAILECFASGVIFYLLGPYIKPHAEAFLKNLSKAKESAPDAQAASSLRARLSGVSRAFSLIAADTAPQEQEEKKEDLYTLALDRVCRACPMSGSCYRYAGDLTRQALEEARGRIAAAKRAHPEDFPPFFAARCQKLADFVGAVNEQLALRESRARYRRRARDDARALEAQYGAIGALFEELARELAPGPEDCTKENLALRRALAQRDIALKAALYRENGRYACTVHSSARLPQGLRRTLEAVVGETVGRTMRFSPADGPPTLRESRAFSLRAAVSAQTKEGESETGDNSAWLRTAQGVDYLILADGMGSGPDAARESGRLIAMLESLLRAGVSPETALKLIHPAFTIRTGGEAFSTCDILRIDLYTGAAKSYKCGAAPSYLCRKGAVPRRISAVSLPFGLPAALPSVDTAGFSLRAGDAVVMLSDGLCGEDDRWLLELLGENRTAAPETLAALVMERGKAVFGLRDDCTVLAVRVGAAERNGKDV